MKNELNLGSIISGVFGVLFVLIGLINLFWGNDPFFGVFIVLLSLIFFVPMEALFKKIIHVKIPLIVKILVGVFILWASLGVGELFDKIELMKQSF